MILVIHNSENIYIVENFKANEVILAEFFQSWYFIIWFAFKYDYYVEKSNTTLYWEFVKVITYNN